MKLFGLCFLVLSMSCFAEPATIISIKEAKHYGFFFEAVGERLVNECQDYIITVPDRHPSIPILIKPSIILYISSGKRISYFKLSTKKIKNKDGDSYISYICVSPVKDDEISVGISYDQDWEKICENNDKCEMYSICYPNWRIIGLEKLLR